MPPDSVSQIKEHWERRARNLALDAEQVTHADRQQRLLEIDVLLQYLPRGQRVLDVGCGNGFSTAIVAQYAAHVVGIDYSAAMIERAQREHGHLANVTFEVQDLLDLHQPSSAFDAVVSQRCLINLDSWEHQQKALTQIAAVLKPGGCFLLQEGTQQGREMLNQTREALGLARMPVVSFNLDFDEEQLWPFLRRDFEIVDVRRFGLYDLISRIVHPLLVSPAAPKYDAKINDIARQVSARLRGADELSREFSAFLRRREH
jgi:ubiquinone/menaquinone biosynthesis C-methylase UbiE